MGRRHVRTEKRASQPALLLNRHGVATTVDTRRCIYCATHSRNRKAGLSPALLLTRYRVAKPDNPTSIVTHRATFVKIEAESGGVEPHPPLDGSKGYQAWPFTGTDHSPIPFGVSAGNDVIRHGVTQTTTEWH